MIRGQLIHPEILKSLGSAGHGAGVLIADGNYPFTTRSNPRADHVYLNLSPGVLSATEVLRVLASAIPVESALVMMPPAPPEPPIFAEFRALLPGVTLDKTGRFEFYDAAGKPDVALVIATGEQRIYANILLTIGVIMPT